MPQYELRLYKCISANPRKHALADRISYEALNDQEAIDLAPGVQIPMFDDSDLAMLFGEDGSVLWVLKA